MDTLYSEALLDVYKHPLNKKALATYNAHTKEQNPVCGDTVEVFIEYSKNGTVKSVGWQGEGCAVSQASASLITDAIKGKTKKEIATISKEDVLEMLGLERLNPTRLRCALLCLEALKKLI